MKHRLSIVCALAVSLLMVSAAVAETKGAAAVNRAHKALRTDLAKVASGIETSLSNSDVKLAETLYELEVRATKLMTRATGVNFGRGQAHAKRESIADLRGTVRHVLRLQERMLDHTLAELDRNLPGEPHRQLWARQGIDLYRPLFRLGTPQPGQPAPKAKDVIRDMQQDFKDKGGSKSKIHYLGPKTIQKFKSGQLVEWVQVGNRIRVTDAGAKHPIIAQSGKDVEGPGAVGKSVRGAGSMQILRGADGEISMVIVSNSSGNYKPGIGSTIGLVEKLEKIGIPSRRIAVTRVLPGEPVLVKLLLKSKKTLDKKQLKARVAKVRSRVIRKASRVLTPAAHLARTKRRASRTRQVKKTPRAAAKKKKPGRTASRSRTRARAR